MADPNGLDDDAAVFGEVKPNEQIVSPKIYAEDGQVIIQLPHIVGGEPFYIRMNPLQATLFATELVKATKQATR